MCIRPRFRIVVLAAMACCVAAVAIADPQLQIPVAPYAPPGYLLVSEEQWAILMEETGLHIDRAREAFVNGHYRTSAAELRKAAIMMRIEASNGPLQAGMPLKQVARQLERHSQFILNGRSTDSIEELDAVSSRALSALAQHAQTKADLAWKMHNDRRSGQYLRAAADNFERAAFRARSHLTVAASGAIKNARVLSDKLVNGADYVVEEVSTGIDSIGNQIERFEHTLLRRPN